jgi:hypothetical protein
MPRLRYLALAGLLTAASAHAGLPTDLAGGLGVNIHFTDARPGELKMLADCGAKLVRMDLVWAATETQAGVYDFAAYDRLLASLDEHGLRALLILDYRHPLYDDNLSPHSDVAIAAFARWAAAAVEHFRGRGVIWEMYNEPNIPQFWTPRPNVKDYIKLAAAVGEAIRRVAPDETYIGPATSGIDLAFLASCFEGGLLRYFDAVSVHPYRRTGPETVEDDYLDLRLLIARHAPKGKHIPILSGEWGYSTALEGVTDEVQAKYLARQWLVNLASDVPMSIWYDWHDDGPDAKDFEHNCGIVEHAYHDGQELVYQPKPSYIAARTLTSQLDGFRFNKRLSMDSPQDFVLLFERDRQLTIVAWTTAGPHAVSIAASPGEFRVVKHLGEAAPPRAVGEKGLEIRLEDAPVYIRPVASNALLDKVAAWERLPQELVTRWQDEVQIRLGTGGVEQVRSIVPGFTQSRQPVRLNWPEQGLGDVWQATTIIVRNPLGFTLAPRVGDAVPVVFDDPSGEALVLKLRLDAPALPSPAGVTVKLQPGGGQRIFMLPCTLPAGAYTAGLSVDLEERPGFVEAVPLRRYQPIPPSPDLWQVRPDGDPAIASEQTLAQSPPPEPVSADGPVLRIDYRFDAGWKFLTLNPIADELAPMPDGVTHLGLWVHGDGSGNPMRLRYIDSAGQVFQPTAGPLDFAGWRYITFDLHQKGIGHWGGKQDGIPHPPLKLDTLFLIDSAERQATKGTVHIASPVWVGTVSPD